MIEFLDKPAYKMDYPFPVPDWHVKQFFNECSIVFDKVDIDMLKIIRRVTPQLLAMDICGFQPMSSKTGPIFALRAKYGKKTFWQKFKDFFKKKELQYYDRDM